ncbi:MAG: AMP-binding protein [Rikenellaceae bacterium]|nr:AMP-binding protein [Rikenellaceae bacterium]
MALDTLREIYLHSTQAYASNRAVSLYGGEQLTYADFGQRVETVTEMLVTAGLGPGDKVALLSSNMPNWGVCYFAVTAAGMIVVPILPDFSADEVGQIIRHADCKALMVSDKLFAKISEETVASLNVVIRTKNLSIIAQNNHDKGSTGIPRPDDVAAIIYTSGTTSQPKGVMLSHHNLCSQLAMVLELQPVVASDVFLSILPLSHTYECSLGFLLPLRQGAQVVYLDRPPTASTLMPAMREIRPTVMLSVPLIIEKIYKSQVAAKFTSSRIKRALYKFPPVRRLIHRFAGHRLMEIFGGRIHFFGIGGAKLDPQTEQFLLEARFPYAIGYGLTETSPLVAGVNPSIVRLQSTGPILKGVKARLEDINPISGEGEIVVSGPNVMLGYYKNPEATQAAFTPDGWFRTKDLGAFDKDGYLYIKGRLNNMILGPSGENIYPEEIENVLNSHIYVADSIVKEEKGKLIALVHFNRDELERRYKNYREEIENRMAAIKEELVQYVNSKVNKFSRISGVVEQAGEFEKTPTHKIKRFLYNKK